MANIKKDVRTEVGNGRSTNFMAHSWATPQSLCHETLQTIPPNLQDLNVDDFWDANCGGWK